MRSSDNANPANGSKYSRFYEKFAPDKTERVPELLAHYGCGGEDSSPNCDEDALNKMLMDEYGLDKLPRPGRAIRVSYGK